MQIRNSAAKNESAMSNVARQILLAAIFALFLYPFSSFAQSCPGSTQWNGGTGTWETAGNWSSGVPGATSNACINVANSVVNVTNSSGDPTLNLDINLNTDTLNINNNDELIIEAGGNILNNGTINLQSTGSGTWLVLDGNTTLSGTGTLTMSNNTANLIWADGGTGRLVNQETIQGAGNIGNAGNFTLVNSGTIDANVSNALTISLNGGTTNTGTLEATAGGTLVITGSTVANASGTILATGTGSKVELNNVSITGGTLTSASGGIIESVDSSVGTTLTNLTISSGTNVNILNNDVLGLGAGTITNNGNINLQSSGSGTWLVVNGTTTLAGTGTVTMSNNTANLIWANGGTGSLTNQETIQGAGNIGNGGNFTLINSGTIDANQSAGLTINPNSTGGITNTGTLEATAGGMLTLSGGSTITNTGGLIEASGSGSTVVLGNTSITGGTLTSTSGGVFESGVTSGTTPAITNVTISTGTTVDLANNFVLNLGAGTITNNGTINLQSSGSGTWLLIDGATTLAGTGNVTMSNNIANAIFGSGGTLTNQETIQGGGTIGNNDLTLVNSGTIDANVSGGTMIINPNGGTTNTKTMEATAGGILNFQTDSVTNSGTILATGAGSVVLLTSNASITGGTLTSSAGGVFEADSATITGVTITAGSIFDVVSNNILNAGAGTITNKGTINIQSTSGQTTWLSLDGNLTLASTGKVILAADGDASIRGTGTLTNQNTIEGSGNIGAGQIGLINSGSILANDKVGAGISDTLVIQTNGTGFTNNVGTKNGILNVSAKNTLIIEGGPFNNFNSTNGTLTGGSYLVAGTLEFAGGTLGLVTNDAAITLTGTAAKILNTSESNASALSGFTTNGSAGTFTVNGGTFTDANTFTNQGIIAVGSAGKFDSTGTLTNFNSTTSTLTGGSYTMTGTGQLQFNNQGDTSDIVTNDAKITLAGVDTTKSSFIDQSGNNALANFNANGSTGSLTLTTNRNFATTAGFTNAGTVTVSKSTGTGHTLLTINGSYQNTGTTTVDGMLTATSINVTGGFIYGNLGTITGAFDLTGGTLNPGDGLKKEGTLNIAGNYAETGSGTLNIDLDGTVAGTKYDVLNISGTAALGGTLNFDLISTFKPTVGETFDVINYSSETGSFTTVNLPTAPAGDHWVFTCGATDCTLTLDSGAAGPASAVTSTHNNVASTVRHAVVHGAAIAGDEMHAPSAILTRAETCGGFRTFASFSCMREAVSGIASGFTRTTASHGTMASTTLHNNVASVSRVHSNVAMARGGDSSSHEPTVSATSVARFYVCAYMPDELARTMGCR